MKSAVVTGAASGIGRATNETLHSIESESGVAKAFQADVCDSHQLGVVVRGVLTSMGSPELLVNIAGIATTATILDTSDQERNRVIGTNLTGPFLLTRAILPLMLESGSGVIVNVASIAGTVGTPHARRTARRQPD
jgi:NAD(P)-dependent dehydrogenase (short-subunit alcohol dehydrogenase family)